MAITATAADNGNAPEIMRGGRGIEWVKVTGSTGIVGDTAAYTCKFITAPLGVVGAASATVSGQTVTIKAAVALGSDTTYVGIIGTYGSI